MTGEKEQSEVIADHQDNPIGIKEDKDPSTFVIEQFIQFNEHRRQINSFSWEIPTAIFASLILIFGLNDEMFAKWRQTPYVPAIGFLLLSLFFVVIMTNHSRNRLTRQWLDNVIQEMERMHGNRPSQYGYKFGEGWSRIQGFSSSKVLSYFLWLLLLLNISIALYYWFMWLMAQSA
jgi:hypothetical protein